MSESEDMNDHGESLGAARPPAPHELSNLTTCAVDTIKEVVWVIVKRSPNLKFGRHEVLVSKPEESGRIPVEILMIFCNPSRSNKPIEITLAFKIQRHEDSPFFTAVFGHRFNGMIDGRPIVVEFRPTPGFITIPTPIIVDCHGG